MELFTIQCTTCRARLKVNDESVIGDILACPKCGSMVQVVPPVGWQRLSATGSGPVTVAVASSPPGTADSPRIKGPPVGDSAIVKAVIPPALPVRAVAPPVSEPVGAASVRPAVPRPQLPTAAELLQFPAAVPKRATKSTARAGLTAAILPVWSTIVARAKHDWMLWSGGLIGGILLGSAIWLAVASRPATALVAEDPARLADSRGDSISEPSSNRSDMAPTDSPPPAADAPAIEPAAEPAAAVDLEPPADTQPAVVREAAAPTPAPPVVAPSPAPPTVQKEPAVGAIKLDPVRNIAGQGPPVDPNAAVVDTADDQPPPPDESVGASPVTRPASPTDSTGSPRRALTQADVDERLGFAMQSVNFTQVPLGQFVEFIAEFTGLPITVDDRALQTIGASRQSLVTVKLSDTTARAALRAALSKLELKCVLRGERVVITTPKDKRPAN